MSLLLSHSVEDLHQFFETVDRFNIDLIIVGNHPDVFLFNLILLLNDRDSNAISSESASSSYSVLKVGIVWLPESKLGDKWHVVVDDEVDFWDIDSSSQDVGTDQTGNLCFSEAIDDSVTFFLVDTTNEHLSRDTNRSKFLLQFTRLFFCVDENHCLVNFLRLI